MNGTVIYCVVYNNSYSTQDGWRKDSPQYQADDKFLEYICYHGRFSFII